MRAGRTGPIPVRPRPATGLDRVVDAVSGLFGARPALSYRPDGRPELPPTRRRRAPVRLYDGAGRAAALEDPALGTRLDVRA